MLVRKSVKQLLTKEEAKDLLEKAPGVPQRLRHRVAQFCSGPYSKEQARAMKAELLGLGLREFEAVNLVDTRPSGLVHMQNIIEEMAERLDEGQMRAILGMFVRRSAANTQDG